MPSAHPPTTESEHPLMDWRALAACDAFDPELFFPHPGSQTQTLEAKEVCARCPVEDECLDWAMNSGEDYGIWGGKTPGERRHIKRVGGWHPRQKVEA